MRIIRTCKEMGIKTVAVYSSADAESLHVRFADEAVCIGPAASSESYLKTSNIISAAEITNADAIHPGYGFLSENAKFSKICDEHNIKFIGASFDMINRMGDKATAKATMKAAGIPTIPGSEGIIDSFEEALKIGNKIGYPIMLKATAGGGGKGMREVWIKEEFSKAWDSATKEAKASFGDEGMYIEKLIEKPRHIEIQVVGDSKGRACHLSERDCSIQRRHQKLTEETPSPFLDEKLREKMGDAAVKATKYIKYEGAGTIEFLVDKHKKFYFMEMNTRIQVEHPITEQVIDFDLIREQIFVASGEKISGKDIMKCFEVVYIDRDDHENQKLLSNSASIRVAWGGQDAIRSITSLPKDPFTEDIIYGPKYSYVIIDEKAISENMTSISQKIALDVSTFDQYACSSPHTVFIKTKDKKIMSDFSKSLSKEMENVERILLPKVKETEDKAKEIISTRSEYEIKGKVISSKNLNWTVITSDEDGFAQPTFSRVIHVRPYNEDSIILGDNRKIQSIGMSVDEKERFDLIDKITFFGGDRCPSLGKMSFFDSPWDGMFGMDRMVRWITTYK